LHYNYLDKAHLFFGEIIKKQKKLKTKVWGDSMGNAIPSGSEVEIKYIEEKNNIKIDDIVVINYNHRIIIHRVISFLKYNNWKGVVTKGDNLDYEDGVFPLNSVIAKIIKVKKPN
jgi:hypothetical protein